MMGGALGRKVVAEGIETSEQLESLRDLGVRFGQGYLLSRPLTPPQGTALLRIASLQLEGVDGKPATVPAVAAAPVSPASAADTLIAAGTVT